MPAKINLEGLSFNRLTVIKEQKVLNRRGAFWLCKCSCGKELVVGSQSIRNGHTKSCGCFALDKLRKMVKEKAAQRAKYRTLKGVSICVGPVYAAWRNMHIRCKDARKDGYKDYGGRGISVDLSWNDFQVFAKDMGPRPKGFSLERVHNNRGYSKENCLWASAKQQALNRRSNILITLGSETYPLSVWSENLGVNYHKLYWLCRTKNLDFSEALKILKVKHEPK